MASLNFTKKKSIWNFIKINRQKKWKKKTFRFHEKIYLCEIWWITKCLFSLLVGILCCTKFKLKNAKMSLQWVNRSFTIFICGWVIFGKEAFTDELIRDPNIVSVCQVLRYVSREQLLLHESSLLGCCYWYIKIPMPPPTLGENWSEFSDLIFMQFWKKKCQKFLWDIFLK